MLVYRDRRFCSAYGVICGNSQCDRALTDDVWRRAKEWWGSDEGVPIDYGDMSGLCTIKTELAAKKIEPRRDCRYFIALLPADIVSCAELNEPRERFAGSAAKCAMCGLYEPKKRNGQSE